MRDILYVPGMKRNLFSIKFIFPLNREEEGYFSILKKVKNAYFYRAGK